MRRSPLPFSPLPRQSGLLPSTPRRREPHPAVSRRSAAYPRLGFAAAVGLACVNLSGVAGAQTGKPFMDYIKPRPITCASLSSETWGVEAVLPRDLCNGIESARGAGVPPEYYYWDGQILKARDGKYHMFLSTWSGADGFNPGWLGSDAFHAISEQGVLGPYRRDDYVYSNNGSHKGHNVSAVELPDGTYAVIVSETVPFTIYTSSSLDGPWTSCQPAIDVASSNVSLFPRHDGRFQVVERYGNIAIADTLCGRYVKQRPTCSYPTDNGDTIYPRRDSIPNVPNPTFDWQEDPHIWRSGGVYHVIYSGSGDRVGWHVYSVDGINDWQDNGYAWSPREYERLFCFEGSTTCSQWYKMERPGVVLEDGHPTHLTWAVADVDKDNQIPGNSNHGSKIIVIPFDGVAFDNDFGVDNGGGAGGAGGSSGGGGAGAGGGNEAGGAPGAAGTAGSDESGGTTGTAGSNATGGAVGLGGSDQTGGALGLGGSNATGGATASGGSSTGGRSSGAGGVPATASGGAIGIGGANTGGVPTNNGSGGNAAGLGGNALGGALGNLGGSSSAVGGQVGGISGATGAGDSPTTGDGDSDSGCGCAIPGRRPSNSGAWLSLLGLALVARRFLGTLSSTGGRTGRRSSRAHPLP